MNKELKIKPIDGQKNSTKCFSPRSNNINGPAHNARARRNSNRMRRYLLKKECDEQLKDYNSAE